jgi:hypothetical protein
MTTIPRRSVTFDNSADYREPQQENHRLKRTVTLVPSQIGGPDQVPVSYTSTPGRLLWYDCQLFISKLKNTFGVFLPLRFGKNADPFDELYPSVPNIMSVIIHSILFVIQTVFLCSLPLYFFAPCIWLIVYVALFFITNGLICRVLNGSDLKVYPKVAVDQNGEFKDEYWIFMNGVAVGLTFLFSICPVLSPH